MKKVVIRRALRASLVAAVGGALLLGGSTAAVAAPVIDPNARGSITIHKFENPNVASGLPANGMEQNVGNSNLTPLNGVTFTIARVDPARYDLTKNTGWEALKDLTVATANPLVEEQSKKTATDGLASFTNLPLGVYLVKETGAPVGVTPAAPFLITVPLTDPENVNNWIYDVHAYPKNDVTTATKTVNDAEAVKVGDTVSWTILGSIPNLPVIDGYKIVDVLPESLARVSTTVTLDSGTATLQPETDYQVSPDGQTVSVTFTPAGLTKLAANNTAMVRVVIAATVKTTGEISNTAAVYPNAASFTVAPGELGGPFVTAPVETKFGSYSIKKASATDGAGLPGASFSVYVSESDARAQRNAVTIDGKSQWTTDENGDATISGLRFSTFANGKQVKEGEIGYQRYWLVETKAPQGYELLAAPVAFEVTEVTPATPLTVTNALSNGGFILPLTGGPGAFATYAVGAALLIGTGVLLFRRRRRTA